MDKIETKRDTKPPRRQRRKSFGVPEDKSEVLNQQADFHYVWFNDSGNTIAEAKEAGYEHVLTSDPERVVSGDVTSNTPNAGVDGRVCRVVDRSGTIAFLMRIPLEFWEEDQAMRNKESLRPLSDLDKTRGRPSDIDENFYVKKSKVTHTIGRRKSESEE